MKIKKEILIGFIIIFAIVVLYYGALYLKNESFKSVNKKLYVVSSTTENMSKNMRIVKNGLQVGTVEKIIPLDETYNSFLFTLYINSDLRIPKNSQLVLTKKLLQSNTLDLIFSNSKEFTKNDDTLILINDMNNSSDIETLTNKTSKLLDSFSALLSLSNNSIRDNLSNVLQNLNEIVSNLKVLSYTLNGVQGNFSRGMKNIDSILQLALGGSHDAVIALHNIKEFSEQTKNIKLKYTVQRVDSVLWSLNSILTKIDSSQGSLGLLVNNKSLYHNLDSSSQNLNFLLKDFKQHPKDYVSFSLFGGGKKKKKKEKDNNIDSTEHK